ncbi:hypothetical protein V6O07_07605, partial [Arthrospira platensis SPKY2]
ITFEEYFNKKDVKNNELYYLFNTNGIRKNTFDSNILQNEVEILEKMLDNYVIHGDSVTYKLQNVYFDLKEALLDPFMEFDISYHLKAKPYYNMITDKKVTREQSMKNITKRAYENSNS